jgi:hypothetical protein
MLGKRALVVEDFRKMRSRCSVFAMCPTPHRMPIGAAARSVRSRLTIATSLDSLARRQIGSHILGWYRGGDGCAKLRLGAAQNQEDVGQRAVSSTSASHSRHHSLSDTSGDVSEYQSCSISLSSS